LSIQRFIAVRKDRDRLLRWWRAKTFTEIGCNVTSCFLQGARHFEPSGGDLVS